MMRFNSTAFGAILARFAWMEREIGDEANRKSPETCGGLRWANPNQHMNMIGRPVYDQSGCTHSSYYAAEVGEQIGAKQRCDQRAAFHGTENQMENDVS
jgi:hypothetical protein